MRYICIVAWATIKSIKARNVQVPSNESCSVVCRHFHTHTHTAQWLTHFFYHLVRGTETWMNEPNERNRRDKHTTLQYNVYSAQAINIYPNSHRIVSPYDIDTKCWHGKQRSPNRRKSIQFTPRDLIYCFNEHKLEKKIEKRAYIFDLRKAARHTSII